MDEGVEPPAPATLPAGGVLAPAPLLCGVACLVLAGLRWFEAAAWTALAGGVLACYVELAARTRAQRWLVALGFVPCLAGLAVSMAHGAVLSRGGQ